MTEKKSKEENKEYKDEVEAPAKEAEKGSGKACDNIGPHLLGRISAPKDKRDYQLGDFLGAADDLDGVLATLLKSGSVAVATKNLAKVAVAHIRKLEGKTPPPPPPPDPTKDVLWGDPDQLDQGQTPHCVGFGCSQFLNADPFNDHYKNADGHLVYYEAKVIDGEPRAEDGSSVHSGIKALKNRGRVGTYAWSTSTADIIAWVRAKGPVVVGSDWYDDMFNPDANGFVTPTGSLAGGHCFIVVGVDVNNNLTFQNSWGAGWGVKGRFKMAENDFNKLVVVDGFEACAVVELPL